MYISELIAVNLSSNALIDFQKPVVNNATALHTVIITDTHYNLLLVQFWFFYLLVWFGGWFYLFFTFKLL